jgi:two-component system, NarL family, invasion response regulator UvrY
LYWSVVLISVLLVDDHELVRTGITRIINDVRGMKVIGEVDSGEAACQFCRTTEPDIVLMDMNMPGIGGIEATKKILRFSPDIKVIILTMHAEDPFPSKVMKNGAQGFLTKTTSPEELINAIKHVNVGQRYISPEIAQQMALSQFNGVDSDKPFESLSERELQIMLMITKGEKVQDIADQLSLSSKTVNSYRYRMFEKLNISNDVELTHLAIRHGMLDMEKL